MLSSVQRAVVGCTLRRAFGTPATTSGSSTVTRKPDATELENSKLQYDAVTHTGQVSEFSLVSDNRSCEICIHRRRGTRKIVG